MDGHDGFEISKATHRAGVHARRPLPLKTRAYLGANVMDLASPHLVNAASIGTTAPDVIHAARGYLRAATTAGRHA